MVSATAKYGYSFDNKGCTRDNYKGEVEMKNDEGNT